jgi:hypothetical protein
MTTMISRRRYPLLAAAVAGLLLMAPAARAYADECWTHRPPCATGAISSYQVEPSHDGGDVFIRLDGWSALCPPDREPEVTPAQESEFGLILYSGTGGWLARLSEYGSATMPQAFSYRVNYTVERPFGPVVAACLAHDYDKRLSCIAVDFEQNPIVVPISVDDHRVTRPILAPCAQCVSEPPPPQ